MTKETRPWGFYETISEGLNYKVKVISINPNSKISLQKHKKRSEHWTVVQGSGIITNGEESIKAKANISVYIPENCLHRAENKNNSKNLVLIEVQCGAYLGEDDIIRFEDDYSRV